MTSQIATHKNCFIAAIVFLRCLLLVPAANAQGTVTHYMVTGAATVTQDDLQLFNTVSFGQPFSAHLYIDHAALPAPLLTQDGNSSWYSWVLQAPGPQQGFSITFGNGITLSTQNAS